MASEKAHIRHSILYEYQLGHSQAEALTNLHQVFGDGTPNSSTVSRWFNRFAGGNFSIEDEPRSGRPREMDLEDLEEAVNADPHQSTRMIAGHLGHDQSTVVRGLALLGKKWKKP
jgi:transposase